MTLNIKDDKLDAAYVAVSNYFGYVAIVQNNGVNSPNPVSRKDFAEDALTDFVEKLMRDEAIANAARIAGENARTTFQPIKKEKK